MEVPHRWRSDALARLCFEQDSVLSRRQLRATGIDRFAVRNQVAALRWRTVGSQVVVLHRGPLTYRQRCWAAVLHAGPGAALDGRTALRLAGMSSEAAGTVDVVLPAAARLPRLPGARFRRTRLEIRPVGSPPRLAPSRAAVRAARLAPTLAVAGGILAATVQQQLAPASMLGQALLEDPTIRGRRALLGLVADIEGGAQAFGEIELGRICRRAGLPTPSRQEVRLDPDGRRRYLDAVIGGVVVEIDGMPHLDVVRQTDDCFRQNERAIGRETVLRFTSLAVRTQPDRVADQIRRAIATRSRDARCA